MKMMQMVVFVAGLILVSAAAITSAASEDVLDRYGRKIPLGKPGAGTGLIVSAVDTHTGFANFHFWLGIRPRDSDDDDDESFPDGSDGGGESDTGEMSDDDDDNVGTGESDSTFARDDNDEIDEDVPVLRTDTRVVMSMNQYPSRVYACRGGKMGLVPIGAQRGTPRDAWIRVKRVEGSGGRHLYHLHITSTPHVGVQFKPLPTFTPTALYCSASEKPTTVQFRVLRRPPPMQLAPLLVSS